MGCRPGRQVGAPSHGPAGLRPPPPLPWPRFLSGSVPLGVRVEPRNFPPGRPEDAGRTTEVPSVLAYELPASRASTGRPAPGFWAGPRVRAPDSSGRRRPALSLRPRGPSAAGWQERVVAPGVSEGGLPATGTRGHFRSRPAGGTPEGCREGYRGRPPSPHDLPLCQSHPQNGLGSRWLRVWAPRAIGVPAQRPGRPHTHPVPQELRARGWWGHRSPKPWVVWKAASPGLFPPTWQGLSGGAGSAARGCIRRSPPGFTSGVTQGGRR